MQSRTLTQLSMFHVKHHRRFGIRLSDGAHRYVLFNSVNLDSQYYSPPPCWMRGQVSTALSLLAHFSPIIVWLRHPIGEPRIHGGYCSQYACNMRPWKMTPTRPPTNADEFGNRQQAATTRPYRRSHQHCQYQACSYRPTQAVFNATGHVIPNRPSASHSVSRLSSSEWVWI